MAEFRIQKRVILEYFIDNNREISSLHNFLNSRFSLSSFQIQDVVQQFSKRISGSFNQKWEIAKRRKDYFFEKYHDWSQTDFVVNFSPRPEPEPSTSGQAGRPALSFSESSERTKKAKSKNLLEKEGAPAIQHAFVHHLRTEKRKEAAEIVQEVAFSDRKRAKTISETISAEGEIPYTKEEALALTIDLKLSREAYESLRRGALKRNSKLYPPYGQILQAKEDCYPQEKIDSDFPITITPSRVDINLQSLLDHTATRIFMSLPKEEISTFPVQIELISKWGCDGASGQSEYKQALPNQEQGISDHHLFMISLVPIQLSSVSENLSATLWKNSRPSSTKYCRPVMFEYSKETKEKTKLEVKKIRDQIDLLSPSQVEFGGNTFFIKHKLVLTMVDGKVCQALSDTPSAASCIVCLATPKLMNNVPKVKERPEIESTFEFGLSTLHAWIRFMENILHISYNLKCRKWSHLNKEEAEEKARRKIAIKAKFREQLNLIIDTPKQGGSGNSNDGNTARRFFANPEITASITEVNVELIRRFAVILQAMASGKKVDIEKFGTYTHETARLYVAKYEWYYMPASVHKILIHGARIIESAILPIGQLSEEAQEARNKDYKRFRLHNTRKSDRIKTITDLAHMLLISSDPFLAEFRNLAKKKTIEMFEEASKLLINDPEEVLE